MDEKVVLSSAEARMAGVLRRTQSDVDVVCVRQRLNTCRLIDEATIEVQAQLLVAFVEHKSDGRRDTLRQAAGSAGVNDEVLRSTPTGTTKAGRGAGRDEHVTATLSRRALAPRGRVAEVQDPLVEASAR